MDKLHPNESGLVWFALIDAEQCRLFNCRSTRHGVPSVHEMAVLENTWPEPERGRPMALSRLTGSTYATPTNATGNRLRRFVEETIRWLDREMRKHEFDAIVVFAPPKTLGALRKARSGPITGRVRHRIGNLRHLAAHRLAEHPLIAGLLASSTGRR